MDLSALESELDAQIATLKLFGRVDTAVGELVHVERVKVKDFEQNLETLVAHAANEVRQFFDVLVVDDIVECLEAQMQWSLGIAKKTALVVLVSVDVLDHTTALKGLRAARVPVNHLKVRAGAVEPNAIEALQCSVSCRQR